MIARLASGLRARVRRFRREEALVTKTIPVQQRVASRQKQSRAPERARTPLAASHLHKPRHSKAHQSLRKCYPCFLETVFNYPTLAECYKVAALDAHNKLAR